MGQIASRLGHAVMPVTSAKLKGWFADVMMLQTTLPLQCDPQRDHYCDLEFEFQGDRERKTVRRLRATSGTHWQKWHHYHHSLVVLVLVLILCMW